MKIVQCVGEISEDEWIRNSSTCYKPEAGLEIAEMKMLRFFGFDKIKNYVIRGRVHVK